MFGATVVTAVLSIEDLFLTVRPIRKGVPEIGIGNVIGSLIFSVTGKLGIVVLARRQHRDRLERPALAPSGARGHDRRSPPTSCGPGSSSAGTAYVLLALYIAYWVVSFVVYGGAPVDD